MSRRINIFIYCVALALNASAATRYVNSGESIGKNLDLCRAGDTLLIGEGVFHEAIVLKDGVTIIGQEGKTILDGTDLDTRLLSCEKDCELPTYVENLVLQNARHNERGGAAWLRGKVIMRHCVVRGSSGLQCGGVLIKGNFPEASAKGAKVEECIIHNCSATGHDWPDAGGVANFDGTLNHCTVANCYGDRYGGIHSESSVYACTFWGNRNEYGFVDPTNYISDESISGTSRADEGFEAHFFEQPWLDTNNEGENGPHFMDPATFAGVPKTAAEEAIVLVADYRVGAPTGVIATMPPARKEDSPADYKLYTSADYTVPSYMAHLVDSGVPLEDKHDPYCMVATINGDPQTRMAFCWFTNEGVKDGEVEITRLRDHEVTRVKATTTTTPPLHYAISSSGILKKAKIDKNTAFRYESHKAVAENLMPGTEYSWRVGYEGHWSEIGHFRTADAEQDTYSFVYMTDSHIQNQEYIDEARLCAEAVARNEKDARFCVFPGDFVDTGTEKNSEWEWERWFEEAMKPVLLQMPLVPTDGNHDESPLMNYNYHFNAGINYSFVYGDMPMIVFSMQDLDYLQSSLGGWFMRQVRKAPDAKWRVGLVHKNLFSGSDHQRDKETPLLRATMLPVMKECHVDLVLQGHDHCYEVIGPVDSTLYFIGATCGAKRYTPLTREEMEASKHIHRVENYYDLFSRLEQPGAPSYTRVTVNKEHILLDTFKVLSDGKIELFNTIQL